ncbi:MAG: MATE family efflux transporter [Desulfomonilaceae bacterium]
MDSAGLFSILSGYVLIIMRGKKNAISGFINNKLDGCAEVLHVSIPLILSTSSLTVALFVDRLMLSWHSVNAVAAATPGGITYFTICCFFQGVAQYTNTLVAQCHGAGDRSGCSKAVWQGVWFSAFSLPLILFCVPLGRWVLGNTGHETDIIALEKEYFTILMFSGVSLPLNAALSSFFSGRGQTSYVLIGNLIGNIGNVALDYLLIFGKFGFPELGIKGAGIATAATNFIPAVYWTCIFLGSRYQAIYRTRKSASLDSRILKALLKFGLPAGAQFFLDVGSFTAFVLIVGRLGSIDLAATNIALSIETLSFLPMVGMSIATSSIVGEYIGRKRPDIAQKRVMCALNLALLYTGLIAIFFWIAPDLLMRLFRPYQQTVSDFNMLLNKGVILIRIIGAYTLFDTVFIIFNGALKGAGDTKFTMWAQIVIAWIFFVPPVYIMTKYLGMGIFTAWIWMLIYVIFIGTVFWLRFRSGHWKTISVLG